MLARILDEKQSFLSMGTGLPLESRCPIPSIVYFPTLRHCNENGKNMESRNKPHDAPLA